MSKPNRRRVVLQQVRTKYIEAVGGEDVELELADGSTVTFPHPLFADDEWKERYDDARSDRDRAIAALGEEQYEKFIAAGGQSGDIPLVIMDLRMSMESELADGTPTRSSTSSENTRKR